MLQDRCKSAIAIVGSLQSYMKYVAESLKNAIAIVGLLQSYKKYVAGSFQKGNCNSRIIAKLQPIRCRIVAKMQQQKQDDCKVTRNALRDRCKYAIAIVGSFQGNKKHVAGSLQKCNCSSRIIAKLQEIRCRIVANVQLQQKDNCKLTRYTLLDRYKSAIARVG